MHTGWGCLHSRCLHSWGRCLHSVYTLTRGFETLETDPKYSPGRKRTRANDGSDMTASVAWAAGQILVERVGFDSAAFRVTVFAFCGTEVSTADFALRSAHVPSVLGGAVCRPRAEQQPPPPPRRSGRSTVRPHVPRSGRVLMRALRCGARAPACRRMPRLAHTLFEHITSTTDDFYRTSWAEYSATLST